MTTAEALRVARATAADRRNNTDLAAALGVSPAAVSKWFAGVNPIPVPHAARVLDLLCARPGARRDLWLAMGVPASDLGGA